MRQRRGRIFQRDTVDPHRHHLRVIRRAAITSRSGVPSLRCSASRSVKVPSASAGILLQQGRRGTDLSE